MRLFRTSKRIRALGVWLGAVCFFASTGAHANSLSSDTSAGSGTLIEDLTYENGPRDSGDSGDSKDKRDWKVDLEYTLTASNGTDSTTSSTVDHTSDFLTTADWIGTQHFEIGGGLEFSFTPEETLYSLGPQAFLGYIFEFGSPPKKKAGSKNDDDSDDDFRPSVEPKLVFQELRYAMTPNSVVTRTGRKREAQPNIEQYAPEAELDIDPFEWIAITGQYTLYSYNRDVNTFLSNLNLLSSIRIGASGLASAVSGLPADLAEIQVTLYPIDPFELELTLQGSTSASDGSYARTGKGVLSMNIGEWKVGLGLERDTSPSLEQNLLLANVEMYF